MHTCRRSRLNSALWRTHVLCFRCIRPAGSSSPSVYTHVRVFELLWLSVELQRTVWCSLFVELSLWLLLLLPLPHLLRCLLVGVSVVDIAAMSFVVNISLSMRTFDGTLNLSVMNQG